MKITKVVNQWIDEISKNIMNEHYKYILLTGLANKNLLFENIKECVTYALHDYKTNKIDKNNNHQINIQETFLILSPMVVRNMNNISFDNDLISIPKNVFESFISE